MGSPVMGNAPASFAPRPAYPARPAFEDKALEAGAGVGGGSPRVLTAGVTPSRPARRPGSPPPRRAPRPAPRPPRTDPPAHADTHRHSPRPAPTAPDASNEPGEPRQHVPAAGRGQPRGPGGLTRTAPSPPGRRPASSTPSAAPSPRTAPPAPAPRPAGRPPPLPRHAQQRRRLPGVRGQQRRRGTPAHRVGVRQPQPVGVDEHRHLGGQHLGHRRGVVPGARADHPRLHPTGPRGPPVRHQRLGKARGSRRPPRAPRSAPPRRRRAARPRRRARRPRGTGPTRPRSRRRPAGTCRSPPPGVGSSAATSACCSASSSGAAGRWSPSPMSTSRTRTGVLARRIDEQRPACACRR